jgi:hypothetical protein
LKTVVCKIFRLATKTGNQLLLKNFDKFGALFL